jgi:uncharacterized membrane protein YbhN (UPF0104 family)
MNRKGRVILQYIFFLGLGGFFAWLSLKNLDQEKISQMKKTLYDARHWMIIPVCVVLFGSHYIRALRWRMLIETLGKTPSKANSFFAVMIGYMTNQVLPRFGEILKCTVIGRYEHVPVDKLIGTIILERLVDGLSLLVVFIVTLILAPGIYHDLTSAIFNAPDTTEEQAIPGNWIAIGLGIVLLIMLIAWMIRKKKTLKDLGLIIINTWKNIWQAITSIGKLKSKGKFIALSIGLWGSYLVAGYLGFLAFRETDVYGWPEAFAILSAGSVGMVIAPGGIGAYAFLVQQTMQLFGLDPVTALAFGLILWIVQSLVIIIGGLISFVAIPYYNKKRLSEPF